MISDTSIPTERFSYHSLHLSTGLPLLPAGQQLILDHFTGYSLIIDWERKQDQVINAITLTEEELYVAFALITSWPSFAPYEKLLMLLSNLPAETPTPSDINDARASRTLDQLIAPLTRTVETCRTKLQALDLDIREIDQYGYRLIAAQRKEA